MKKCRSLPVIESNNCSLMQKRAYFEFEYEIKMSVSLSVILKDSFLIKVNNILNEFLMGEYGTLNIVSWYKGAILSTVKDVLWK